MIINKFYEKLYKELINKLESDYILIPNTPENRKAINNTLTTVPCTSKTLSLIIIATLICMPFNTINTLPTPTYHPTVQVSILDISDGSSHQKGKNKLSEIQELILKYGKKHSLLKTKSQAKPAILLVSNPPLEN